MNMILQLYPDERLKKKIRTKNLMPLSRQAGSRGCDYQNLHVAVTDLMSFRSTSTSADFSNDVTSASPLPRLDIFHLRTPI
jgi:hypothetical protein